MTVQAKITCCGNSPDDRLFVGNQSGDVVHWFDELKVGESSMLTPPQKPGQAKWVFSAIHGTVPQEDPVVAAYQPGESRPAPKKGEDNGK